jgi:hypothetical protein
MRTSRLGEGPHRPSRPSGGAAARPGGAAGRIITAAEVIRELWRPWATLSGMLILLTHYGLLCRYRWCGASDKSELLGQVTPARSWLRQPTTAAIASSYGFRLASRVAALFVRRPATRTERSPEAEPVWEAASHSEARRPITARGRCGSKPRPAPTCCA